MNTQAQGLGKQYIHYNPERTDYSITPEELTSLESAGSNFWKDICLVSGPLGLSCIINAIAATPSPFQLNLALFLNYLLGALGLVLAVVFGIAWGKSARRFTKIIRQIKEKPRMEVVPSTTNIGAIQVSPAQVKS